MSLRAGSVDRELHDQGAELDLLEALAPGLSNRSAIDVGAERGATAAALRASGYGPIWLIEPFPGNAEALRDRFAGDPEVRVLEVAAGRRDETAELQLAEDAAGGSLDAFHSLVRQPSREGLRWNGSVRVPVRSLGSLCAAGELPRRVGLLKVDAEGFDAEVLAGAAGIRCDVVMVEFWRDVPETVGRCPYSLDELRALVAPLGPRRFLFVRHNESRVSLAPWDSAEVSEGEWGNLVFVTEGLVDAAEAAIPAIGRALARRDRRVVPEQEAGRFAAPHRDLRARLAARAHRLRTPALGRLRLHAPRPLAVPRAYLRERAPSAPPRISIVSPPDRRGGRLERTIHSVASQSYPELEHILLEEPGDRQAEATDRGLDGSAGDVMACLDPGHLLLPGSLAYVGRYFERHPRVEVIYGHRIIVDEHEREVGRWLLPRHDDDAMALADYVPQETLFWRRRAWERTGGLDTELDLTAHWDLLLRFMRAECRIVRVPRFLAAFRIDEDRESSERAARREDEARRVRERWHGRDRSAGEIAARLRPYHRRHKLHHWAHRLRRPITPEVELTSGTEFGFRAAGGSTAG